MSQLRYDRLPASLRSSMVNYIEHCVEPGSFLSAVLCNDLKESCARADDQNRYILWDIVSWLYSDAPSICWGSELRYNQWLARRNAQ